MEGWIKLYRKFLNWEWSSNPNMVALFIHLLLNANYKDDSWKGIEVKRGQFVTGLDSLNTITGISIQTLRTCLDKLKSTSEITIKVTNKYRIITITNYDDYQIIEEDTNKQVNKQTNKQLTATKEVKNIKEVIIKKENIKEKTLQVTKFENWLSINAPLVLKMEIQISDENLTKLKNGYSLEEIQDILIKMHNYKPLLKKNIDAYLTANNWLNKNKTDKNERGNNFSKGKSISERSSSELAKKEGYGQLV